MMTIASANTISSNDSGSCDIHRELNQLNASPGQNQTASSPNRSSEARDVVRDLSNSKSGNASQKNRKNQRGGKKRALAQSQEDYSDEIQKLSCLLGGIPFFKDRKISSEADLEEISKPLLLE